MTNEATKTTNKLLAALVGVTIALAVVAVLLISSLGNDAAMDHRMPDGMTMSGEEHRP